MHASPTSGPLLLCVDLEAGSEALARHAGENARACGRAVEVLHVLPPHGPEKEFESARRRLERLARETLSGVRLLGIEIRRGVPEEDLTAYARERGAGIIVLGRRKRPEVERIYVGSTTSAVLSLATCPVLVVPLPPPYSDG
ncbi:universal stress protein [Rhodocaloribacter sp.]